MKMFENNMKKNSSLFLLYHPNKNTFDLIKIDLTNKIHPILIENLILLKKKQKIRDSNE